MVIGVSTDILGMLIQFNLSIAFMGFSTALIRRKLRKISCAILPLFLGLLSLSVILLQIVEFSGKNELIPFGSFAVIVSFSALGLSWSRVPGKSGQEIEAANKSGSDLFLASLLALCSSALAWVIGTIKFLPRFLEIPILILHIFLLALALIIFVISMTRLINLAKNECL
jgi:signal transduction histidine kinase